MILKINCFFMKQIVQIMLVAALLVLSSCNKHQYIITVTNTLAVERLNETVTADIEQLQLSSNQINLLDKETGHTVRCQLIDSNKDGVFESIAFQTSLKSQESKQYVLGQDMSVALNTEVKTVARFVPERTDDFAWENDRVAFRTFGPEAQRMAEAG